MEGWPEDARDGLAPDHACSYADEFDEFNVSWAPTLKALWSPKGQQVRIFTPGQPTKHDGIGAVNDYTGETVVLFRRHKRRRESAELLHALLDQHPTGTVYVAWDNANTHADAADAADAADEAVVQAATGQLALLYLPPDSPWLNPIALRWRHFRREVTQCQLFETVQTLLSAAQAFFDRYNSSRTPSSRSSAPMPRNKLDCTYYYSCTYQTRLEFSDAKASKLCYRLEPGSASFLTGY